MDLTLDDELVVVQVAVVGGHAVVTAHVLTAQALLAGHQGLEQLLAVAGADDVRAGVAEQLLHGLGQVTDGGGVGLLDEQIARVCMLKREHDQVNGLVQVHQEAGHIGVGDRDGVAGADLVNEQRNDAAAAAHDVAVAGAADRRAAALGGHAGVGKDDVLHHRLGDAHGVDGIGGLVGGQADDALHARVNGGVQDIVRADDVRLHGLHREELAGGHLFQRCRVEDVVDAGHGIPDGLRVAHVADVELDLAGILRVVGLQLVAHVVLLLLIAGEDADLADVGGQEMLEHRMPEAARAAGDEKSLALKNAVCHNILLIIGCAKGTVILYNLIHFSTKIAA